MKIWNLQHNFKKILKYEYEDSEEAINILQSIEDDAKYHGYEYDLFRVALIHNIKNNYNECLKYLKDSLEIAYSNSNVFVINEVSMFLAYIHLAQKDYELALQMYLSVINYEKYPRALNNIGHIYSTMGDFDEALKYYKKAHEVLENYGEYSDYDNSLRSIIHVNLADVLFRFRKYDEAEKSAYDSMNIAKLSNDGYGIGSALYTLCKIEIERANYPNAIKHILEAKKYFENCSLMNQEMISFDVDECLRLYSKALRLSNDFDISIEISNSIFDKTKEDYEILIDNYESLGKIEDAYKTYKLYLEAVKQKEEVDQQLLSDSYKSKIKVLETEKKVNEYELLYKNTKSISEIGREIISANNLDDVIEVIYQKINNIMNYETIAIGLVDHEKEILNYDWIYENNQLEEPITVDINDKNRFSSWVVRNKEAIKINEALTGKEVLKYKEEIKPFTHGAVIQSMIIVPIILKEDIFGILSVQSTLKYQYTDYDLEVLKMLSSFIAVAIKNWKNKKSLRDANDKLHILSKIDALTGISNRHVLSELVENLFDENSSSSKKLSVVMIDIDYFKEFNDTYGHYDGDTCIVKVAKEIALRLDVNGNQLFRYGGDEFVAIIPDLNKSDVESLLEAARKGIEELKIENKHSETNKYVTCSFGFTTITKSKTMDYQKAFYLADKALYVSKANGKNQVAFEHIYE